MAGYDSYLDKYDRMQLTKRQREVHMAELHETRMGKTFYESDVPALLRHLDTIATTLEQLVAAVNKQTDVVERGVVQVANVGLALHGLRRAIKSAGGEKT